MSIYHENGYVNIPWIYRRGITWQAITGGRATGKTFGALQMVVDDHIPFIYLRRMQAQADLINKPDFSPFRSINTARGWNIGTVPVTKYNAAFYQMEADENGKMQPAGDPLGYTGALSTLSNLRGFDASKVELLIYDEFIPERHERPLKHEFDALANAYETINRNRELQGRPPLRVLLLSNANMIGNPVFVGLNLVKRAVRMEQTGTELWEDKQRGIGLYMLQNSRISKAKQDTALYKLTAGSRFADMALNNEFAEDRSSTVIRSRKLSELAPLVNVGELCLYEVKAESGLLYACTHRSGSAPEYEMTDTDLLRIRRVYAWVLLAYLDGRVECEDRLSESLLQSVFNI